MRPRDLLPLAARGLFRGFDAAAAAFTAAAVTAMCFSGAVLLAVREEKSEPCELSVTAPNSSSITEQTVEDLRAIPRVLSATGTVEVTVTAHTGDYTAALTVTGIDGAYLEVDYTAGGLFPTEGAMPWLALSDEAAKTFVDPGEKARRSTDYMPDIDWLHAAFTLTLDGAAVPARVSSLFESDTAEAYMDKDAARSLLQSQGLTGAYTGARVRAENSGAAEAVADAVTAMDLRVDDLDSTRQERWDARTRESAYLAALGGARLLCAGLLRLTGAALDRGRERRRDVLRWAGTEERVLRGLDALRGALLSLVGAMAGAGLHYLLAALAGLDNGSEVPALPLVWLPVPVIFSVLAGLAWSLGIFALGAKKPMDLGESSC